MRAHPRRIPRIERVTAGFLRDAGFILRLYRETTRPPYVRLLSKRARRPVSNTAALIRLGDDRPRWRDRATYRSPRVARNRVDLKNLNRSPYNDLQKNANPRLGFEFSRVAPPVGPPSPNRVRGAKDIEQVVFADGKNELTRHLKY